MSNPHEQARSGYETGAYQEQNPSGPPARQGSYQDRGGFSGDRGRQFHSGSGYSSKGQSFNRDRFRGGSDGYRDQAPRDFSVDPPKLYKPYVGAGEEDLPEAVAAQFREVRDLLQKEGFTCRTSGFKGADALFRESPGKELILPWKGFADMDSKTAFTSDEAKFLAKQFADNYDNLPDAVKTFLGTDVRLVMGHNLHSPALFVVIYTEDGTEDYSKRKGYIKRRGHVIAVATKLRIPVFNFKNPDAKDRLLQYLQLKTTAPSMP